MPLQRERFTLCTLLHTRNTFKILRAYSSRRRRHSRLRIQECSLPHPPRRSGTCTCTYSSLPSQRPRRMIPTLCYNHRMFCASLKRWCAYANTRSGTSFDFDANRAARGASSPPRLDEGFPTAPRVLVTRKRGAKNPTELQT